MLFHHVIYLVLFAVVVQGEEHVHVIGPFRKPHFKIDRPSAFNCNRSTSISSRSNLSSTVLIADLQVSTTNYSNNEQIDVSWTPSKASCKDDFIAVYFVEVPLDTGALDYIDYEVVKPGQGNMSWSMVNVRRQLDFRYYSRDHQCSGNYTIIARSPAIEPLNYNEPVHIHMAYGDRIDQMSISFLTNSNQSTPQCQYGLDPSSLKFHAIGTTTTYTASDMCEGKANIPGTQTFIDPGYMHTVLLNDLRSSITYYYRVGSDEHGWSSVLTFTNRPSSNDKEVSLIAFGDMGVSPLRPGEKPTVDRILARVLSNNVTCVLHIGDVSYATGTGVYWDAFMSEIESITSRVPYMVGIGNHEYDHVTGGDKDPSGAPGDGGFRPKWGDYGYDSGGECAVPMVRRFHSPSNGNGLFWYSFDVGPVHIVYYSTEHDFRRSSPQYAWFEQDLRSVNRSRTPWLIVGSHRPMYTSLEQSDLTRTMLQLYLEPLLYKYKVDLNLFAHTHSYERTCPMYQQRCVDDGVTHLLIGMGGYYLSYGTYSGAEWSIYHDIATGYTQIWANQTHLNFNYYHTDNDALIDHFQLKK